MRMTEAYARTNHMYSLNESDLFGRGADEEQEAEVSDSNWWALLALALVVATAAGNILVCLAITWERRLQNVTNYFLMSLAVTDLMVAILVMPLGILTLVKGKSYGNFKPIFLNNINVVLDNSNLISYEY